MKKDKTKHYSLLFKYVKPYKKEFILAFSLTIVEASLEMFVPFLMNYHLSLGVYQDEYNNLVRRN